MINNIYKYLSQIEWKISDNLIDFDGAYNFMEDRVSKIINQKKSEMIWLLEHKDVYTAGISSKETDLLNKTNIPVFKTNRGGKYTYHGPNMKIIYLMLDLKKFFYPNSPDIAVFVNFLENWIIDILAEFKIKGEIRKDRVGIWVKNEISEEKIAAIGIKVKKWVTYHGISINLAPDLTKFNNIVPCGISDFGITSFAKLGINNFSNIDQLIKEKFNQKFLEFKS